MSVGPRDSSTIDTTPIIDDTAQYDALNIIINGLSLRSQDVLSLQINYEDIIKAKLSFVDTMNLAEFAPLTAAGIQISFNDATKRNNDLNFVVAKMETVRIKNNQINITLTLEEVTSNMLANTYISKSFVKKTFMQMLEEVTTEESIEIDYFAGDSDFIYDFFVFPANISLLDLIRKQSKLNNIIMFSNRNGLLISNRDSVNFGELQGPAENVFVLDRNKEYPYWNIMEYKGITANTKNTQKVCKTTLSNNTDIMNLGHFPTTITLEDVYEDQKLNNGIGYNEVALPDMFYSSGEKQVAHFAHNETTGDLEDYRDILTSQQKFNIIVQGLNVDRVYSIIRISLPRSVNVQTPQDDEVFSGLFVVTSVIDSIFAGNFIQHLTLQSADYGKGPAELKA